MEYGKLSVWHHWTRIKCPWNQICSVLGIIHKSSFTKPTKQLKMEWLGLVWSRKPHCNPEYFWKVSWIFAEAIAKVWDLTALPLHVYMSTFSKLFPLNNPNHLMRKRNPEKYAVNISKTERYKMSAVPYLQRLLNDDYAMQKKNLKSLLQVNNDVSYNVPIT